MNRVALSVALVLCVAGTCLGFVERRILIDGTMWDWQAVLASDDNASIDARGGDGDLDDPVWVDLRRFAVTFDDDALYLHLADWRMVWPIARQQVVFLFYLDLDHDGSFGTADAILAQRINDVLLTDRALYDYVPATGPVDPIPGDGVAVAGSGGGTRPATIAAVEDLIRGTIELSITWGSLGLAPGSPVTVRAAIAYLSAPGTSADAVTQLPSGVDDNVAAVDTGYIGLDLSPGGTFAAIAGESVDFPHALRASGTLPQSVDIAAQVDDALRVELWTDPDGDGDPTDGIRIATDLNGDGDCVDPGDTIEPGYDTTSDGRPDLPIGPGSTLNFVVRLFPTEPYQRMTAVTVQSVRDPSLSRVAVDLSRAYDLTLLPRNIRTAAADSEVRFRHSACNGSGAPIDAILLVDSGLGWPTRAERGGLPLGGLSLEPRECVDFDVFLTVPLGVPATTEDLVTVRAVMPSSTTYEYDELTVVANEVSLGPDRDSTALAGTSVFYGHAIDNHSSFSRGFLLDSDHAPSATFWSDPDGDRSPDDGRPTVSTATVAPSGGHVDLVAQLDIDPAVTPGTEVTTTIVAADPTAVPPLERTTVDRTEIRLIATYPQAPPAPVVDVFAGCSTVYAMAGPLPTVPVADLYRMEWFDALGDLAFLGSASTPSGSGFVESELTLWLNDPPGTWTVRLARLDGAVWTPVEPAGSHDFEVARELEGLGGEIAILMTDQVAYPISGATVSLSSSVVNRWSVGLEGTTLEYVLFADDNVDGRVSLGDRYLRLDGVVETWNEGRRTCRPPGLPRVDPEAEVAVGSCNDIGPVDWGTNGGWYAQATWRSGCGDVIARRVVGFNVGCNPAPVDRGGPDRLICAGDTTELGIGAAEPGIDYRWSPTIALDDPTNASPRATPTSPTTYTLNVTDPSGCVIRDDVRVEVAAAPFADAGPSRTVCAGVGTRLGTPPLPGLTYAWEPGGGLDDPSAAQPFATPAVTTAYTLRVDDPTLPCRPARVVVVDVAEPPVADPGADRGFGSTIGPDVCVAGVSYEWSPPQGLDDPGACNPTANPATTTQYCLAVRDQESGCASAPACVTVGDGACPDPPAPGATQDAPAVLGPGVCEPGLLYRWTPSVGLSDPDACNPIANPADTTEYCVTAEDVGSGCVSLAVCTTVTVPSCPSPPGPVADLRLARSGADVALSWTETDRADGGYHVYRVDNLSRLADPPSAGLQVVTTDADRLAVSGVDLEAVAAPGTYGYRVVAVCGDGSEGP